MEFELRSYNAEKVKKVLSDYVPGKNILINDVSLSGVTSIEIEDCIKYDMEPEPEIGYDGGEEKFIILRFNLENGYAAYSFCPDRQVCEIIFEQDNLWIIRISDTDEYVKKQKDYLEFRLNEYKEYMSK